MTNYQKGQQSAGPIMVLIFLIALFIILYLLLIPPSDRSTLLNRTSGSSGNANNNDVSTGGSANTLLLESPGLVSGLEEDTSIRQINPVNVFVKYEPSIKTISNSLTVEKGSFSDEDQNIFFDTPNFENIRRALLTFAVSENTGSLIISLNGNVIFSNEIDETSLQIINLPTSYLTNRNELFFEVSGPGGAFWRTNKYVLEDIKIKEEYEIANAEEKRTFILDNEELDNIDKSRLEYSVYCGSADSEDTSFRIYLNDELLTSEIISCGSGERGADVSADRFREGENKLTFIIDKGDYLVNNIKLVNDLKKSETRTYFFNINSKDFFDVQDGIKDVFLQMSFDNDGEKRAEIWVNDFITYVDTDGDSFSDDISELVEEGENFIKILPGNEFVIRSLRVTLE